MSSAAVSCEAVETLREILRFCHIHQYIDHKTCVWKISSVPWAMRCCRRFWAQSCGSSILPAQSSACISVTIVNTTSPTCCKSKVPTIPCAPQCRHQHQQFYWTPSCEATCSAKRCVLRLSESESRWRGKVGKEEGSVKSYVQSR